MAGMTSFHSSKDVTCCYLDWYRRYHKDSLEVLVITTMMIHDDDDDIDHGDDSDDADILMVRMMNIVPSTEANNHS